MIEGDIPGAFEGRIADGPVSLYRAEDAGAPPVSLSTEPAPRTYRIVRAAKRTVVTESQVAAYMVRRQRELADAAELARIYPSQPEFAAMAQMLQAEIDQCAALLGG